MQQLVIQVTLKAQPNPRCEVIDNQLRPMIMETFRTSNLSYFRWRRAIFRLCPDGAQVITHEFHFMRFSLLQAYQVSGFVYEESFRRCAGAPSGAGEFFDWRFGANIKYFVSCQKVFNPDSAEIQADLASGEIHRYRVKLESERYVHFRVNFAGVDGVLTLYSREKEKLEQVSLPRGTEAMKELWWITKEGN